MKNSAQFSVCSGQYAVSERLLKRTISFVRVAAYCILITGYCALAGCGDKPGDTVKNDTVKENPLMKNLSEQEQEELRKIIASIPVPFAILDKVSGSALPYKKEMLNLPANVAHYNTAEGQALNIGVFGADMAYIIAFERLGESADYLRSIRQLADAVVIPTVFDEGAMNKYNMNADKQDSMQTMMYESYTRIDSTLQSNERFGLAALVLTGGWIESLYLTTQELGNETRNDNNKLLYEMLDDQQKHTDKVISLLAMFPKDSIFVQLHNDISELKKMSSPATEYTVEELEKVTAQVAAIRKKLIDIE